MCVKHLRISMPVLLTAILMLGTLFAQEQAKAHTNAQHQIQTDNAACQQRLTGKFALSSKHYVPLTALANNNDDNKAQISKKFMATQLVAMYFLDEGQQSKTKTPDLTDLAKVMPLDTPLWHIIPVNNQTRSHTLQVNPPANTPFKTDNSTVRFLDAKSLLPQLKQRQAHTADQARNMSMTLLEALLGFQPSLANGCEISLPHNAQSVQLIRINTANLPENNVLKMQRYLADLLSVNMTLDELKNQHYWLGSYLVIPEVTSMLVFLPVMKMQTNP